MYLTKILLDVTQRRVQNRHRTAYQTHRSILRAFPDPLPPVERLLFRRDLSRRDAIIQLLVQSHTAPDWRMFIDDHGYGLLETPQVTTFDPTVIQVGQYLAFRLLANPTVKRDGKRHGLQSEADQLNWLHRKGEAAGFEVNLNHLRITNDGMMRDGGSRGNAISVLMVRYDGLLEITGAPAFHAALMEGVGPGKGMGCGLLSVAAVR